MDNVQLRDRLNDLRISRNLVERTMSGLRPEDGSHPGITAEWEEAMGLLARMHGGIMDLLVKLDRGELTAATP